MDLKPHITTPDSAEKLAGWLRTRGGIAIWQSVDFGRAGMTITTPASTAEGEPAPKPAYWVASKPALIITDPADVVVSNDVEVQRFRVGLRMGDNGLKIKCTDAASRRIERAVTKAGEGSYHLFDYETQEAIIMKPQSQVPLLDYLASQSNRK